MIEYILKSIYNNYLKASNKNYLYKQNNIVKLINK